MTDLKEWTPRFNEDAPVKGNPEYDGMPEERLVAPPIAA
jgi:hypothetical protein